MNTKANLKILSALLLLCVCCNTTLSMFVVLEETPIDRLVSNVTAYVRENPTDANGYYVLGRIHYLAFSHKVLSIPMLDKGIKILPEFPGYFVLNGVSKIRIYNETYENSLRELSTSRYPYKRKFELPEKSQKIFLDLYHKDTEIKVERSFGKKIQLNDPNELIQHVTEAIKYFHIAINMNPNNGLYHLGLASLLEQYTYYLEEINLKEMPKELRDIIFNRAREIYYTAYQLSINDDLKPDHGSIGAGFRSLASYEAGTAYMRLTELQNTITETDKTKILEIQKSLDKGLRQNSGIVTPIVFSFEIYYSPVDLLERNLQVNFDLNGDGASELWPWVKPDTGILVWNEDGKGEITSGRQLFGSVTWWLFFNDGYHALDCLDDNRNGSLSGSELKGISVWFDTNSNGKSEKGEIKSLEELGIMSISTKSTSTENGWPANKTGIKLKTSRTIPTYDWIVSPKS